MRRPTFTADSTPDATPYSTALPRSSNAFGTAVIDYALAAIAGIWLADGLALLLAPRGVMTQVLDVVRQSPHMLQWEVLSIIGGMFLFFVGRDVRYQPLWFVIATGMVCKGLFLTVGPHTWHTRVFDWCGAREDVDLRFYGLGLCILAVLLLHALGWIGHA